MTIDSNPTHPRHLNPLTRTRRPIVGVLANAWMDGALPGQTVDNKYLEALTELADVTAVIIPARDLEGDIDGLLDVMDGMLLTGAVSNVHPRHYEGQGDEDHYSPFDPGRDVSALRLLEGVLERDMPLLAICRGMQELNVSRGGTLAPAIQLDALRFCHGPWDKAAELEQLYGPAHALQVEPGGMLADLLGDQPMQVNSLHLQAIDRLGAGLHVEGRAQDGTIEAVSVAGRRFALGVQWHPEFKAASNPVSCHIFKAFGTAAAQYQGARA